MTAQRLAPWPSIARVIPPGPGPTCTKPVTAGPQAGILPHLHHGAARQLPRRPGKPGHNTVQAGRQLAYSVVLVQQPRVHDKVLREILGRVDPVNTENVLFDQYI